MYDGQREHGPQIRLNWIFIPQWVIPTKMPYSTKSLMGLIINFKDKHINLYKSLSNSEIAYALGASYNVVTRGKKYLADNGYVNKAGEMICDDDGEVLRDG